MEERRKEDCETLKQMKEDNEKNIEKLNRKMDRNQEDLTQMRVDNETLLKQNNDELKK